jgi:hypothetical protein
MKTYPIYGENGLCTAFELGSVYVSPGKIASLLESVPGVTQINRKSLRGDVRVEFKYSNNDFVTVEPFGDNSRYWIGPIEFEKSQIDVNVIKAVFDNYVPPFWLRVIGGIISS